MTRFILALVLAAAPQDGDALKAQFEKETDAGRRREILRKLADLKHSAAEELSIAILRDSSRQAALVPEAAAVAVSVGSKPLYSALLKAAGKESAPEILLPLIEAIGTIGAPAGLSTLKPHLSHADSRVAVAAARAVAKIGGEGGRDVLLALEDDPRLDVKKAVIAALGTFKHEHTHPKLLRYYLEPETRRDAVISLAQEPDLRVVDAYLDGLASSDAALRAACVRAFVILGDAAMPIIERRLEFHRIPPAAVEELQRIFGTPRPILRWLVLGPLPPSPTEPFDITQNEGGMDELVFSRPFSGVGDKEVRWTFVQADDDGRVGLTPILSPPTNGMVYGYASLRSPSARTVRLQAGGDDTLAIWVGGNKVYERKEARAWTPDSDTVEVPLKKGQNYFLVKVLQKEGDWAFSVRVPDAREGKLFQRKPERRDPAATLEFAVGNAGNAARGATLFAGAGGCSKCHAVGEEGGGVGPDLSNAGALHARKDLAERVLFPAKTVRDGFRHEVVLTRTGQLVPGVVKEDTLDELILTDPEGNTRRLLKPEIVRRVKGEGSLMPDALNAPLSKEDVADLLSYLESLKK